MAATAALTVAASLLALWFADWVAAKALRSPLERAATQAGVQWDSRNRLDVVLDKRSENANWFPAVPANTYLERPLKLGQRRVIALGGVASAHVVGCNENGYFSTFDTDEFGFNNPPGARSAPGPAIYLVGDSFTQGDCLRPGDSIVDRMRDRHPHTMNLGVGGNGPLFELAAVREYAREAKAGVIVWMYYEGNDLNDLRRDRADPLLARYLEPGFTQDLRSNQDAVNAAVRSMVEERLVEHARSRSRLLPNLRELFWQARQRRAVPSSVAAAQTQERTVSEPPRDEVTDFLTIVALARDEALKNGGAMVFAYLPEFQRYAELPLSRGASQRERVLAGVRALGVPIVDVHEAFVATGRPRTLFPFGINGHYNAEGAEVAAKALLVALRR